MKKWVIVGGLMFVAAIFLFVGKGNMVTKRETSEISLSDIQEYINSGSSGEYSWNQEMTLVIETDEGTFSGSSVVKVIWEKNSPRINGPSWIPKIIGEMPFVELPGERYFFLLTKNGFRNLPERFLLGDGWKNNSVGAESPENNKLVMSPNDERFPYLITFANINDPKTIRFALLDNVSLTVEKTTQQVTSAQILQKLPWLSELPRKSVRSMPTIFTTPSGGYAALYKSDLIEE